jgi:hypothetical protein
VGDNVRVNLEVELVPGVSHEVRLAAMFDQVVRWHFAQTRLEMPEEVRDEVGRVAKWMAGRFGAIT